MRVVKSWNGAWSQAIGDKEATPVQLGPFQGRPFLAMMQGTAASDSGGSGDHTVGYEFTVWRNSAPEGQPADWVQVGSKSACFYAHSGDTHGMTPMVWIDLQTAVAGDVLHVTVVKGESWPHTAPGTDDYFSIAIAELDEDV